MSGGFIIAFSVLTLGSALLTSIINDYAIKTVLFSFNVLLLGYLGVSTLRKSFIYDDTLIFEKDSNVNQKINIKSKILKRLVTGLAIVVTSPWSYLWWASFGSYIIFGDFNSFDLLPRLGIVLCFLSGIFTWVFSFSSLLTISKRFANSTFLNIITKASAVVLLLYALNFSLETLTYFKLWLM